MIQFVSIAKCNTRICACDFQETWLPWKIVRRGLKHGWVTRKGCMYYAPTLSVEQLNEMGGPTDA